MTWNADIESYEDDDSVEPCEHCGSTEGSYLDDDNRYRCHNCGKAVGVVCPLCGGEGFMPEDEMECDWINYTDELVTCRECNGEGWVKHPSFQ